MTTPADVVAELFRLVDVPKLQPRYNIAPTQAVAVIRIDRNCTPAVRRLEMLRWGLVPHWAKDASIGSRMINARSETAATKPSFREPMRYRRCLIPTSGFYEWRKRPSGKQPYFIHMKDGQPFAFAGLFEHWESADGSSIDSCTILTTEPNELLSDIHNRMPVILHADDYQGWLDPDNQDPQSLASLLVPFPADPMTMRPVSTHVNRPANDDARCVEPVTSP